MMSTSQRILFFFVIPIIAPLFFPPQMLQGGFVGIIAEVILFGVLGFFLMRGRSTALKLSIFLQGLNVIIRMMMIFPHFSHADGSFDYMYTLASVISIALSLYMVLRFDRVDIRTQMVQ
jgi:hypothetical protein